MNTLKDKPLLLYLPGFDGTLLAPFLQFPELSTEFDVRGMTVSMSDRSSVQNLRDYVLDFLRHETKCKSSKEVYIMGESFGGILAFLTAISIQEHNTICTTAHEHIYLQGIVTINPATCYDRSNLATFGPPVANTNPFLYPLALLSLLPLFTDEMALPQLLLILQGKGLPSVIDNATREAYMGRMAFSLPSKLKFMPQETLKWRLEEWLTKGCQMIKDEEDNLQKMDIPVLIVAGEKDQTLPSVEEARRLSNLLKHSQLHIVDSSGHACTCGSRVDLTALIRSTFVHLNATDGRKKMKMEASENEGVYFGLERRYDNSTVGLSPLTYWSSAYYQRLE
jgi:pimeloyl-ACP methyl ester carboxylesterase